MPRKFFKQVLRVTVLTEDKPLRHYGNLGLVHEAITAGDCSGAIEEVSCTEMTPQEAVKNLEAQGSEPGFFRLGEDGEDMDIDEDRGR